MASGTISRGRALKLAGGALLGAALIPFGAAPAEARKRRRRNFCRRNADVCTNPVDAKDCKSNPDCKCLTDASGRLQCVHIGVGGLICPTEDKCDRNDDCPRGEVCISVSGECCPGNTNNYCQPKCP